MPITLQKGLIYIALANCKASYYPYYDSTFNNDLKEFKEKNSIPETTAIVFQNDITFNKSDLISSYFGEMMPFLAMSKAVSKTGFILLTILSTRKKALSFMVIHII